MRCESGEILLQHLRGRDDAGGWTGPIYHPITSLWATRILHRVLGTGKKKEKKIKLEAAFGDGGKIPEEDHSLLLFFHGKSHHHELQKAGRKNGKQVGEKMEIN